MRIAVDATSIGGGQGGDETMLRGLVGALVAHTSVHAIDLIVRRAAVDEVTDVIGHDGRTRLHPMRRASGSLHFLVALPRAIRRLPERPDLVLAVNHAPAYGAVPCALMVQDLSFLHLPDSYPLRHRARLRSVVAHQVPRADAVLTVSDFSRRDLIDSYHLDPARVHTIPNVIQEPVEPSDAERAEFERARLEHGIGDRFLLYLGNLHPRKNVARSLAAFVAARRRGLDDDIKFVVAGATWWGDGEERRIAADHPESIVMTGRVSDAVRDGLLRSALGLVYLSSFEGFGLPPLEAMIRGTPALVSDRGSLPEVTGGRASVVDPDDQIAVVDALLEMAAPDAPMHTTSERALGRAQAASYSSARAGRALDAALASMAPGTVSA